MFGIAFFVLLCVFNVTTMSLDGSPLTRYTPCGLGIVHFDKTDGFWRAIVNLDLYKDFGDDAIFTIDFEKKVKLVEVLPNNLIPHKNAVNNLNFNVKGGILPAFNFTIQLSDDPTEVPVVKKITFNNMTLCDDNVKKSQTVESLNVTRSENYQHVCGRRALQNTEVTSLRTEAEPGDWPWHVAILVKSKSGRSTSYQCGGSIISRRAILTAGHCVSRNNVIIAPKRIIVIAGTTDHSDIDQVGRQTFVAEDVILHPNYVDAEATSDLAILKISNLEYTEYVQPICLWGPVYDKTNLFGYQATVVGFGATRDNKPSNVLRSAYTLVQNDSTCIGYDSDVYKPLLNEFTFCAGYGPNSVVNPRNGDSGGGLVVPTLQPDHKISWFLRGVLSKCGVAAGETDCSPEFYIVYTDVGPHYGWINHHSGLVYTNNVLHKNYDSL